MQKRSQDNDDDKSHHQIGYKRRQQDALDDQLWKGVCHQVASRGNSMPLHRSTMLLVRTRHAATSASIVSLPNLFTHPVCDGTKRGRISLDDRRACFVCQWCKWPIDELHQLCIAMP